MTSAITPAFGAVRVLLPPERRVASCPGRRGDGERFIHFAFEDGSEKRIAQFSWFDEAHLIYIDGTDIIERHGRSFFIIREKSFNAAHDKLHEEIYPAIDSGKI